MKRSEVEQWQQIGPTAVLDVPGQPTRYVWQLADPDGQRWTCDRQHRQVLRLPEPGESAEWQNLDE